MTPDVLDELEVKSIKQRLVQSQSEKALLELEVNALKQKAEQLQAALELSRYAPDPPTLRKALLLWRKGFVTAYSIRAGIGLVTRVLRFRRVPHSLADILSEKHLVFREDAVRWGLFFGTYSGGYVLVQAAVQRVRKRQEELRGTVRPGHDAAKTNGAHTCVSTKASDLPPMLDSVLAGSISGLAIFFLDAKTRRALALYAVVRLAQCGAKSLRDRGMVPATVARFQHTESLLFLFCAAQVMYAYVMRPETLPSSYWNFIVRTGPIHKTVLKGVRDSNRGSPVDVVALREYCHRRNPSAEPLLIHANSHRIPCEVLHPQTPECWRHCIWSAFQAFQRTFPVHFPIFLVPFCIFNHKRALAKPIHTLSTAAVSAVRSSTFLGLFVGLYMCTVCVQRNTMKRDHKSLYYIAGMVAGLAIAVEKPSRRQELTLYVLPRALDSLYMLLRDRKLLAAVPYGEAFLFCACGGGLLAFWEREKHNVSPLVRSIVDHFWLLDKPVTKPLPETKDDGLESSEKLTYIEN
mmetsp:Transcript_12483/g.45513  ORF Transcript_12483/g.45513 Transcript_12483/m.45513 type:complete len:520 (+) Transcript_12483:191-1750(+)